MSLTDEQLEQFRTEMRGTEAEQLVYSEILHLRSENAALRRAVESHVNDKADWLRQLSDDFARLRREESGWIRVSDRAPTGDDGIVLAHFDGGTVSLATCFHGEWSHELDNPDAVPTHWQPLPEDPTDAEE